MLSMRLAAGVAARPLSRFPTSDISNVRNFSSVSKTLAVEPVTGALGAEVSGVDLSKIETLDESVLEEIRQAFYEHSVLFFRDQKLNPKQHLAFAKRLNWGPLERHPIVKGLDEYPEVLQIVREANKPAQFGETWHSDNSYAEKPSLGSVLRGVEIPPYGNDTMFASMYKVYESFSPAFQKMLGELKGVHTAGRAFSADNKEREKKYANDTKEAMKYQKSEVLFQEVHHPVIRTHPITKKKALYINSMFTTGFVGWTEQESKPLLDFLFAQIERPEFQCRFRWKSNSLAMWDNRCVQHLAIGDSIPARRVMQRITIQGEKPF